MKQAAFRTERRQRRRQRRRHPLSCAERRCADERPVSCRPFTGDPAYPGYGRLRRLPWRGPHRRRRRWSPWAPPPDWRRHHETSGRHSPFSAAS